jgi:nicotinamide-nucleotide amidase
VDQTLSALADLAAQRRHGRTIACAESFTAGLVAQSLASAGNASDWFRGGVVAYSSEVKWHVLGVTRGPVVEESAAKEMAAGVAKLLGADVGMSTTGVAGPGPQEGRPAGTVIIGWWVDGRSGADTLHFDGDPESVVVKGTRATLARLAAALSELPAGELTAESN